MSFNSVVFFLNTECISCKRNKWKRFEYWIFQILDLNQRLYEIKDLVIKIVEKLRSILRIVKNILRVKFDYGLYINSFKFME